MKSDDRQLTSEREQLLHIAVSARMAARQTAVPERARWLRALAAVVETAAGMGQ